MVVKPCLAGDITKREQQVATLLLERTGVPERQADSHDKEEFQTINLKIWII